MTFIECNALTEVRSAMSGSGDLICVLPEGHDGPHYDDVDDITWQKGKPDGV